MSAAQHTYPRLRTLSRFAWIFCSLVFAFSVLVRLDGQLAGGVVLGSITATVGSVAVAILSMVDGQVVGTGSHIAYRGMRFYVEPMCTGIDVASMFAAAVIAFPAPWRAKLRGLTGGVALLALVNLARVVGLVFAGAYWPGKLDYLHREIFPLIMMLVSLTIFVRWTRGADRDGPPPR